MKVKAHTLRNKTKTDLLKELDELRGELAQLRVAQVAGGAASKLAKIKVVRKGIARVLTVYRQKQLVELRKQYAGKKWLPIDLRKKKTRAMRRRMTPYQENLKTARVTKRAKNYPKLKFFLKSA
eukprot:NODE_25245_length_594_cov_1.700214.p2 GENE.NODE_25245_length_594_cov_1.700214~~NODE_25245_length_594_cov_1.700214.p2  ORF type:complete len:124 (-),score=37.50 NODE_25245_length_594_cov_1.700214:114-485(-)